MVLLFDCIHCTVPIIEDESLIFVRVSTFLAAAI